MSAPEREQTPSPIDTADPVDTAGEAQAEVERKDERRPARRLPDLKAAADRVLEARRAVRPRRLRRP